MWNLLGGHKASCRAAREYLEKAVEGGELLPWKEWLDAAPDEVRAHLKECQACRYEAEGLIAARSLLRGALAASKDPGPEFTAGVMRAIAAREQSRREVPTAWFVLPRLAAQFAWVSAIALVLTGTWAYEHRPVATASTTSTDAFLDPAPQSTSQDDVLLSLAGNAP